MKSTSSKKATSSWSFATVCEELDRRQRVTLGLERMEALLALLGNPEHKLRIVQVVGTNGKGTTAVSLATALQAAGHSAGAYLSPHLISYTERLMICNEKITEEAFAAVMGEVIRTADEGEVPATQFELLTAGAIKAFHDAGLEWAVLEAGLGARHDATSAAKAEAVVLTSVGLDHMQYLGDTIEEIATEKLASLRSGSTLILGTEDPVVKELARRECQKIGAKLVDVTLEDGSLEESGFATATAPYVVRNARLGVRAAEALLDRKFDHDVLGRSIESARSILPARFERHEVRGVPVVVDGGHNEPGLRAALGAMKCVYPDRPLSVVFGCLRDKDIVSMLVAVESEADSVVLTRAANERAADPEWLEREYAPRDVEGRRARVVRDAGDAMDVAVEEMKRVGGIVLVTGSLYTCAPVLERLRDE